jgi:carboxylesterase type B
MAPSFLASVLVGCIALLSHAATAPTVVDGTVSYVGTLQDGVESFLGIKYGQDTGGANRFKHPVPYSYPAGAVVNVTSPAAACPQQTGNPTPSLVGLFSNVTNISEACLTIRVDRPPNTTADARLPVMVYLYGGGYAIGQIYDMAYDPVGLVRETAPKGIPIIYVAIK